jgi:galactokinase
MMHPVLKLEMLAAEDIVSRLVSIVAIDAAGREADPATEGAADASTPASAGDDVDVRVRSLLQHCVHALQHAGVEGTAAVHAFMVPGRIEVLGKHTDYAGGRSLLVAVERGFVILACARADHRIRVMDALSGEVAELAGTATPDAPLWARYPATVAHRLDRNFAEATGGCDIAFASDLPPAAGLSSSSALVVAVYLALAAVRRVSDTAIYRDRIRSAEQLAGYLGAVENGLAFGDLAGEAGVGTMGGSEDHTAIVAARRDRLVQYGFTPVHFETAVPMPASHVFVVAASGVRAEKAGAARGAYNHLAGQVHRLVHLWQTATGHATPSLAAAVRSRPDAALRLGRIIRERTDADEAGPLLSRLAQFVTESEELVPGAAAALQNGDLAAFAHHADRSQQLAARALGNQVAETMDLVQTARRLGAVAASAFGAGFGGSVWALVAATDAEHFSAAWRAAYVAGFPQHEAVCTFFTTRPGPPACRLVLPASPTAGA